MLLSRKVKQNSKKLENVSVNDENLKRKTQNGHTIVLLSTGKVSFIPFLCQHVTVSEIIPWPEFLYIKQASNGHTGFLINDLYE